MTPGKTYPVEVLTQDEVKALIEASSPRCPTGRRNRALVAVLYRCGLRISEALDLMPKDIDASAGTIRVLHGKGDKARTVGADPGCFAILALWLHDRESLPVVGATPVFCTLQGRPMHDAYVRAMLPRLAERAGIAKRVHAHGLRHTHAAELAKENVPLNVIQAQLGHANAAVTSRYIQHIAPQQVIETMRARAW